MRCEVCGFEFAGSHDCSGIQPHALPEEMMPPPDGICPGYYLAMAFRIAGCDGIAIRRTSRDPDALFYGAIFSTIAASITFFVTALPKMLTREGRTPGTIFWGLLLGLLFVCIYSVAVVFIQIGVAHFIVRTLLRGEGTLFAAMQPALLGCFVNCLSLIPVAGPALAATAWTAVMMKVLEEVDGTARVPALLISATINGIFLALLYLVSH
jgi:hypothetical protein